ncbi:MAG TPA: hypothetical protein VF269_01070 [Rhodanobacteraceae bacterium]
MSHDALWEQLQNDWQATTPAVDVRALATKARRKRHRMISFQALEVVLACAFTGLCLYIPSPLGPGRIAAATTWGLLGAAWLEVIAKLWLRLGTWKAENTDTRALLQLARKRARAGLRFVWITLGIVALMYAAIAPWAWRGWAHGTHHQHLVLLGMLIEQVFFLAVILGWAVWYAIRQKRKWRRAQALLDQLD